MRTKYRQTRLARKDNETPGRFTIKKCKGCGVDVQISLATKHEGSDAPLCELCRASIADMYQRNS